MSKPPTEPMLFVLRSLVAGRGMGQPRYLRGQERLILQGLLNRGLIEYDATDWPVVTDAGREAAG